MYKHTYISEEFVAKQWLGINIFDIKNFIKCNCKYKVVIEHKGNILCITTKYSEDLTFVIYVKHGDYVAIRDNYLLKFSSNVFENNLDEYYGGYYKED